MTEIRYAVRLLVKSPGFTLVAVLTLALGIGANTAIFSLISSVLLRPLPVEEPDRLVSVFTTDRRNPGNIPVVSHLNYLDYRDHNDVLTDLAVFDAFGQVNLGSGADAEQVAAHLVSGNYFDVLGIRAARGRTIRPDDDRVPGAHPIAVISHGFWERRFGAAPDIVGRTIALNRHAFTIVGVAPRGFTGTLLFGVPDLWVPMAMHEVVRPGFTWYNERRGLFLGVFGRLKPGVEMEQARAAFAALAAQLEREYPNENDGRSALVMPLVEGRINPDGQGQITLISGLLMGVVGIVLLVACANLANLLLARATGRRREIAVRRALGANRGRLVRQLLTESLLLALVGGAAGLVLASWTLALMGPSLPLPQALIDELALDTRVLLFTAALAMAAGLLFGLGPALHASAADVVPVLKQEATAAGPGTSGFGLRKVLLVGQVALSVVALVLAAVFLRSLRQAQAVEPGFETDRVLVMSFDLGREGYTPERGQALYEQIAERVAGLPGVRSAVMARNAPFAGGILRSLLLEGQEASAGDRVLVQNNIVGPGYFDVMGIPLASGRDFASSDRGGMPLVAIVNQTMAERFWPGQNPVGRRFRFFGDDGFTEIVGIVRDTKYNSLTESPQPFVYQPLLQEYTPAATLHVRTVAEAGAAAGAVRREVQSLDPNLLLFDVQTLRAQVDQSLAPQRFNAALLWIFGLLALFLAAIGVYGVTNYSVSQRTREIGIRMALGADRARVLALVVRQGMALVLVGVLIGAAASALATRLVGSLLFNVGPVDPVAFALAVLLLVAAAALATGVPARRATRVDPVTALRAE